MPIPLIVYGALAAFQAMSGAQQAAGIQQQAEFKQRIDDQNAALADVDAYETEKFGLSESARYANVVDSTVSQQRVGYASEGVDVNFGTAADIQAETKLTGFLNQLEIQRQAREKAAGYRREAINLRLGAGAVGMQGAINAGAAQTAGITSAASTGISGYEHYYGTGTKTKPISGVG